MSVYIGIDPGKTGAIASIGQGRDGAIFLPMLGSNDVDVNGLATWFRMLPVGMVILEKAQAMPRQGVVSMFNYGDIYGQLKALLRLESYRYVEVSPSVWKRKMGLIGKDKSESIRIASQLFPNVDLKLKRDHNRAEALLLAEYGRREFTQTI